MKNLIFILLLTGILITSCRNESANLETIIIGDVSAKPNAKYFISNSFNLYDKHNLEVLNNAIHFKTSSTGLKIVYFSYTTNNSVFISFPMLLEPDTIEFKFKNSELKFKKGKENIAFQKARNRLLNAYQILRKEQRLTNTERNKQLADSIISANNNFASILCLKMRLKDFGPKLSFETLKKLNISKEVKNSVVYKEVYTSIFSQINDCNALGSLASNFLLTDTLGTIHSLQSINSNHIKIFFSIKPNNGKSRTELTHIKEIYEKFKEYNIDFISVVNEINTDSAIQYIKEESIPWMTLVETSNKNNTHIYYSRAIFQNGNFLLNENNEVIKNNFTTSELEEFLIKRFTPEKYSHYLQEKYKTNNSEIKIISDFNFINSLEDLSKIANKKPIFIDCWASWCTYCIKEFKYKNELETFLEKQGIELVYLDFDENEEDWLKDIKEYKLKGTHIRVNKNLQKDLKNKKLQPHLPTYILLDSAGKVLIDYALQPSKKDKLYNQIKEHIE